MRLPYELREAVIEVAQRAFWVKGPLIDLLRTAGVPEALIRQFGNEPKVVMMRTILQELDRRGAEGYEIQRRILTELCNLEAPHATVTDRAAAARALHRLQSPAGGQRGDVESEQQRARQRQQKVERQVELATERRAKLQELLAWFRTMVTTGDDPQRRGRGLQELLQTLFELHDITYHPPARTTTDEVDGSFENKNLPYIVEARWRKEHPGQGDLGAFLTKVEQRIGGTRGLFVSIPGFRDEVVSMFDRRGNSLLLMDGPDLILILEEQVTPGAALDLKLRRAQTYGDIYFQLRER